ncbi:hypothetical protein HN51_041027 [Arachis hypogaea]|uniref:Rx N-terminal domain-containing protein n=1 Tax=Arachis hypogaea TaxID=3818 RepID=A0A444YQP0_ARAHY|nr:uncharacterized protein LOC107604778 [Arachis ipaensis]XP_025658283.1 uncharacterized protein LOC112754746 [Arachis hypogaea]QHN86716.1 uncharacterized protein DS421_16g548620 [Arachis hypogaea]RYR04280.1 hypothetical protein Ahy_B06g083944 [Arachis hypogaea]
MIHRNVQRLLLLLLFLGFSSYLLLSASAVPATRTQNLDGEESEDASLLLSLAKNMQKLENNVKDVVIDVEERFINRRMDLETQDYEGTGANKDHDPKSPGSV